MADKEKHTYPSETPSTDPSLRSGLRLAVRAAPVPATQAVPRTCGSGQVSPPVSGRRPRGADGRRAPGPNGVQANRGGGAAAPRGGETSLGVPPLPMILVHMQNDPQNAAAKTTIRSIRAEEDIAEEDVAVRLIVRLIEHLKQAS